MDAVKASKQRPLPGKKLSLGSHVSEHDAARVYNEHALRLKGNNAHLNDGAGACACVGARCFQHTRAYHLTVPSDNEVDTEPDPQEPMMQGKSGFRGVTWDRRENRWRARITYQGKHKAIGRCVGRCCLSTMT